MKITRRKLVLGTVGAAALFPLSYAVRVSVGGYSYPKSYSHLSAKEAVIIAALAETLIPSNNHLGLSTEAVDTVGAANDFVAIGSKLEQSEFHLLFWTIEHLFPFIGGYFTKFSKLSIEERQHILQKLERSASEVPRLLFRAVRAIVCFSYFNTMQVKEQLGIKDWCHS